MDRYKYNFGLDTFSTHLGRTHVNTNITERFHEMISWSLTFRLLLCLLIVYLNARCLHTLKLSLLVSYSQEKLSVWFLIDSWDVRVIIKTNTFQNGGYRMRTLWHMHLSEKCSFFFHVIHASFSDLIIKTSWKALGTLGVPTYSYLKGSL